MRYADTITIADLRECARRRLPRVVFDYLEGGAEDEITLARNRAAFALEASAVLLGRAPLYGVAAAGEAGVDRALQILSDETARVMELVGCTSVSTLSRDVVRVVGAVPPESTDDHTHVRSSNV